MLSRVQQLLSSVVNLVFHDPDQPRRIWAWWQLLLVLGAAALIVVAVATA